MELVKKGGLSGRLHIWADGVYFTPRLDGDRQCMLVIIGADEYGEKDVLAIADGFCENADSWRDLLKGLKKRGLMMPPELAIGDGGTGKTRARVGGRYGRATPDLRFPQLVICDVADPSCSMSLNNFGPNFVRR